MGNEIDIEEFGWRYACPVSHRDVLGTMQWCKRTFGDLGYRWSVRFGSNHNRFIFKKKEDHAMFALTWHEDIVQLD